MNQNVTSAEAQAYRLEQVYEQLASELNQPGVRQRLQTASGETEWSVTQVLGHMVEMIPYWLTHCRTLLATTGSPPPFGRALDAPERLAGVAHGQAATLDALMGRLKTEISIAAGMMRRLSPAERNQKGIHNRRGEMTVAEVLEALIVAHAEEHLAQVRQTLQT